MNNAVNLLPESCHNARCRARRRNAWTALVSSAGLLVAGSWVALRATNQTIVRLERDLVAVQTRQSQLNRQFTLVSKLRNKLVEEGRALAGLRQELWLPEQWLALTRQAPDGVVFTEIRGWPLDDAPSPSRGSSNASRETTTNREKNPMLEQHLSARVVQISGHALDHDQLTRLIDALQHVPRWQEVELLRAARQPSHPGAVLAFKLECRQEDVAR